MAATPVCQSSAEAAPAGTPAHGQAHGLPNVTPGGACMLFLPHLLLEVSTLAQATHKLKLLLCG